MAKNTETLTIKVEAETDQARRDLHALEEVADDIKIDVDTDEAQHSIDDLLQDVEKLSSEDATIELKLAQQDLGRQLEAIRSDVEKLDASDATIDLKMEQGDALIADIDKIESKLKEINATEVRVDVESTTANVGKLGESADGAKSALANMVGNAAQDLGALGGVAGSAGVAVGQLAEYFADARLDADNAGKSFGSLAKSFAPVLGPIVGIGAAVAVGSKLWGNYQAAQAEVQRQTDDVAKALIELDGIVEQVNEDIAAQAEVGDFGDKLLSSLTLTDEKIVDILGSATQLGIAFTDVGDIIAGMGEKGDLQGFDLLITHIQENLGLTREQAEGVAKAVSDSGSNWDLLGQAINNNTDLTWDQINAMKAQLLLYGQIGQAAKDTDINEGAQQYLDTLKLTKAGLDQIADATERLRDQGILDPSAIQIASEIGRANTEVARSLDDLNRSAAESQQIARATAQNWRILLDDLADGRIDTQAAADAWNILQTALGLTDDQMQKLVDTKLAEKIAEDEQALKDAAEAADKFAQSLAEAAANVNSSDFRSGAISTVFDQLNELSRLDTSSQLTDIADAFTAIDDAARAYPKSIVPFDLIPDNWDEVKNMPEDLQGITDAIGGFRDAVQTQLAEAFTFGGPEALRQAAADITTQFEGPFREMMARNNASVEETNEAWNQFLRDVGLAPENIEMTVTLAVDQQKLQVLQDIASGAGLEGERKLNFDIAISNNDPTTALAILNEQLAGVGQEVVITYNADTGQVETALVPLTQPVTVPVTTGAPDTSTTDAALATYSVSGITVPVATANDPSVDETQQQLDEFGNPVNVTVLAPKSPSLGAMDKLIDHVARDRDVDLNVKADNAGAINVILDTVAEQRTAHFFAQADNVTVTDTALDTLAMPTEDGRLAHIFAQPTNVAAAASILNALANDRTVHLRVQIDNYNEVERQLDFLARPRTQTITTRLGGSRNGAAVN